MQFTLLNFSTTQQLKIVVSRPPYEGFKDLGLDLNPRSSLPAQILTLFLLVACILHFTNWLHVDYIGNVKDSILSLKSFMIHPENGLHLSL